MAGSGTRETGLGNECVGLGLQFPPTSLLDLCRAPGQANEETIYLPRTLVAVPKQVFAVTSSRTQSQMASSGLKSGL